MRGRIVLLAGFSGSVLAACALLTDLDGFASGAGVSAPSDAAIDAATGPGSPDAQVDAGPKCKGTSGPTPIAVGPYCIDATEVTAADYRVFLATTDSAPPKQSDECSGNTSFAPFLQVEDDKPVFGVDWCDAVAYCTWAGKRLCGGIGGGSTPLASLLDVKVDEWHRACTKDGAHPFPYGDTFDGTKCNGFGGPGPVAVASRTGCEGGYPGIFDMSGNLREWTNACESKAPNARCIVRGGSYGAQNQGKCGDTTLVPRNRGDSNNDITIRCCSDLEP